ncbi:hypothetical protein BDV98DRAFT_571100 [Pterulicium gracile]|uniref:Hydrophobin n=1 Tax=Pterulicium gracile TaxID=1884261 RepID=A0A5C3QEA9_9AGAR|nr:hypothetical protein BDV98DRAFT_571100 [Pterula gracilis]
MFMLHHSVLIAAAVMTSSVVSRPTYGKTSTSTTKVLNAPVENQCNFVGGSQCCQSIDIPGPEILTSLIGLVNMPLDANGLVGHGCSPLIGLDATCNTQAVCCSHKHEAIFLGCNNIIL